MKLPRGPAPTIRLATEADGARLAEIFVLAQRTAFDWQPGGTVRAESYARAVAGEEVWVAALAGRVFAFMSIWRPDDFLHNLFVDPAWQGLGLGRRLIEHVLRRRGTSLELKTDLENAAARRFYRGLGGTEVGRGETHGGKWVRYRLARELINV